MNELLEKYLQNGLADFAGLEIRGHIPVKQELINAVLAEALRPDAETMSSASTGAVSITATPKPAKSIDSKALIALLRGMVKQAEITATEGAIVLDFELRR